MTTTSNDLAERVREKMRADPVGFIKTVLGFDPWSKQQEIIESVRDNQRTAVRSCHGSGKTATAARVVAWFLAAHPNSRVITTAPTYMQVRDLLWSEIHRAVYAAPPGLFPEPGITRLSFKRDWFAVGISTDTPERFQGHHAENLLLVVDEASGVDEEIFEAAEGFLTSDNARVLLVGNPTRTSGTFYRAFHSEQALYNTLHISAYDTPNITGEKVSEATARALVSRGWIEEKVGQWGVESSMFQIRVLGQFPVDADDAVVPKSWMAKSRVEQEHSERRAKPRELGVDVGAGGDESVIALRAGMRGRILHRDRNPDTMRTVGHIMEHAVKERVTAIKVDSIGIGKGVGDRLKELVRERGLKIEVILVNVGERSDDPKRFPRLRDQLWWEIGRELSEHQGWDLSEIDDDAAAQICAPRYTLDSSGRIKVEPKSETIARLGNSPDAADALLLAWYSGRPTKRWRIL